MERERTLTVARQPQQCCMRIGSTLAAQLGAAQCLYQRTADGKTLTRQAPLQQVECGSEFILRIGMIFFMGAGSVDQTVYRIHQPLESGQTSRERNACATEEYDPPTLMLSQE
ncbi:MAG: hypothetical protein HQL77_17685 [Magnetococcales bacterium]|nr:hypothetical protein [Magnetococcales bacterium]